MTVSGVLHSFLVGGGHVQARFWMRTEHLDEFR